MIRRHIIAELNTWAESEDRKPLVLRGARQVGKTTVVKEFAKKFDTFLSLNLDLQDDQKPFLNHDNIQDIVDAIYRHCGKAKKGKTLLFIDEIQTLPKAVAKLRYFYEEVPELYVIAAGSLLETLIDTNISFPVGRVDYLVLRPCSFLEFLSAIDDDFDADLIEKLEATDVHSRLMSAFYNFAIVGGMPEAVAKYAKKKDVFAADSVYQSLLISYMDDVLKYEKKNAAIQVLRFVIQKGWLAAGETITFNNFVDGKYKSAEIGETLRVLERAMLLELVYPTSSSQMPIMTNNRKHPKLIWLDTGLVNYFAGIRKDLFSVTDIQDAWRGRVAEHIVAQELIALNYNFLTKRAYWNKDKDVSMAEVDFLYQYNGLVIPIEVKSGHNAKLKSLHIYMDSAPHDVAIRVWSNPYSVDVVKTLSGKTFRLVNIPFYYVCVLDKILEKLV